MNKKILSVIAAIGFLLAACGGQVSAKSPGDPAAGKKLFSQVAIRQAPGCVTCHSIEPGKIIIGPSLAGVGTRAAQRIPGKSAIDYLQESITSPNAYVVDGFPAGVMYQHFKDVIGAEEIDNLVAFLLTQK